MNVELPYPIGTLLTRVEDGKEHTDKLYYYMVDEMGVGVKLWLDAGTSELRLSDRIDLSDLTKGWKVNQINEINDSHSMKR